MDKNKLHRLIKVFMYAADDEKRQQKKYLRYQKIFFEDKGLCKLFGWLYREEVEHENKLREKYISMKKERKRKGG